MFHQCAVRFTKIALVVAAISLGAEEVTAADCPDHGSLKASITTEKDRECAVQSSGTFRAYRVVGNRVAAAPTTAFSLNDRVILCVRLPYDGYIAVWDAPPAGERERLYPNRISHPRGENGVFVAAAQEHCIGEVDSGYEIEITPGEGVGRGQFYLLVTEKLELQLGKDDFVVPGYGLSASIRAEGRPAVEQLKGYADTWLVYDVRQ